MRRAVAMLGYAGLSLCVGLVMWSVWSRDTRGSSWPFPRRVRTVAQLERKTGTDLPMCAALVEGVDDRQATGQTICAVLVMPAKDAVRLLAQAPFGPGAASSSARSVRDSQCASMQTWRPNRARRFISRRTRYSLAPTSRAVGRREVLLSVLVSLDKAPVATAYFHWVLRSSSEAGNAP